MSPNQSSNATDSNISAEVEGQLTTLLYRNAWITQLVNLINASLLAYVNGTLHAPAIPAFIWWAVTGAITAGRYALARRFTAAAPDTDATAIWRRRYVAGTAVSAAAWASGAVLFMWHAPATALLFTGLVMAGMTAGAVPVLAPVPTAYRVYAYPVLLTTMMVILLQATTALYWAYGAMTGLFTAVVLLGARYLHDTLDSAIRVGLREARLAREHELSLIARLQTEKALQDSEQRYRLILQHSPTGILHYDPDLVITYCNDRLAQILRAPIEQLLGLDMKTLKDQRILPALRLALEGRTGSYEGEYVSTMASARIWVSMSCAPLLSPQGEQQGGIAIVDDITERKTTERQIQSLLREQQVLLDNAIVGIVKAKDRTIVWANHAFEAMLGYEPGELQGKPTRQAFVSQADYDTLGAEAYPILHSRGQFTAEFQHRRKDGQIIWVDIRGSLLDPDKGESLWTFLDITERKDADQALRRSEARLRYMLETSPSAVRIAGLAGRRVLFANPRYAELVGKPVDALVGLDPTSYYVHPEEYQAVLDEIARGGQVTDRLVELRIPGAGTKWALASYLQLEYEGGPAVLAWLYDITERKRMETALLDSEARLNLAQHIAQIGNWELDLPRNSLFWSDEIFRIFEIDPQAFGASYDAFLATIHPDDREAVNKAYRDSIENKTPYEIEHRLLFPDGRIKYVLERCESEFDAEGTPLRSSGTVQDITDRKLAELALERSEATFRALIDAIEETVILLDQDSKVLAINEVGAWRLNKQPADVIGEDLLQLLPPELARSRVQSIRKVFATGKADHIQDVRAGLHYDINYYPVFDDSGKVVKVAVYAADVTERLRLFEIDKLFHTIDQQLLSGRPGEDIFERICADVTQIFDLQYSWIGRKEPDGKVSILAGAGPASGYGVELERIGVCWDDSPTGKGPTGTTIRSGHSQLFKQLDSGFQPWRAAARRHHLKAILGIPLIIRGEVYGAMTLYSQDEDSFDRKNVVQHLSNIAGRVCVALEKARDQQQLRLLGTALSATANGVFITDRRGRILWLNEAFTALTGYTASDALGMTPIILNSGRQDAEFFTRLWDHVLRGEVWRSEMVNRRKNGTEFHVRQTITPIQGDDGTVTHFVSIMEDISVEKVAEARIEHMAHYDALTDLPNRWLFLDRLRQAVALAKRTDTPLALLFLDLDRFKAVNDGLGHHVGDLLLQQVAARVRDCIRDSDTVARLAGDEFTVLLPRIVTRADAVRVAEKILAVFNQPFEIEGNTVVSGTSIGIALFSGEDIDGEELLKRADAAMYTAKQAGRNNYAVFEPA